MHRRLIEAISDDGADLETFEADVSKRGGRPEGRNGRESAALGWVRGDIRERR